MDVVSKVPDFSAFLNNPTIPRNEKIAKVRLKNYFEVLHMTSVSLPG
jgi:hypothetical protein